MPTRDLTVPVRKQFEIAAKGASLEDNCLKGAASVTGCLDRGRDCIFPGAWKSCLKGFRENGFVAVGHKWSELPVAMPVSAKEVGNQLLTEAQFHSTQAAQDARTVCVERLEKKLSVGLSVGFMLDYGDDDSPSYVYFESGQKLLDFAKANGYDMSLFDQKGIKACTGWCCGILKIAELIEYSIVPIPCNQLAGATEAKAWGGAATIETERDFEAFLREAGFSRKDATAVSLHGFKALKRDAAATDEPTGEEVPGDAMAKELTPEQTQADGLESQADDLQFRTLCLRLDSIKAAIPA